MDCRTAQEQILECLDEGAWPAQLGTHVAGCETCAAFLAMQTSLDARLSRTLATPQLSPGFRAALHRSIAAESTPWVRDALPDIFHFVGWAAATAVCLRFLSLDPGLVFVTGAVTALSTYVLVTIVRSTLEDA
jgi:hypothetical protein